MAKKSRKKSAKHQKAPAEVLVESPAQLVGSNGANPLQEHQITSETQVKPAKIKKSRKKSAKHQETPAEVLPESPAQSVGSIGVHQQSQVKIPQTSSSSVIQPKKTRKARRKSKTCEPLTSLPSSPLSDFDSLNPQQEREVEKPSIT